MQATETGLRWGARVLSIVYYFALIPLVIDVFSVGINLRSFYLFSYAVLGVSGLQIGFKESDRWVRVWFWLNLIYETVITSFVFFWPAFGLYAALTDWEKWIHLGLLITAIIFLGLNLIVPPKPLKPVTREEDLEAGLPPMANQNPAQ